MKRAVPTAEYIAVLGEVAASSYLFTWLMHPPGPEDPIISAVKWLIVFLLMIVIKAKYVRMDFKLFFMHSKVILYGDQDATLLTTKRVHILIARTHGSLMIHGTWKAQS